MTAKVIDQIDPRVVPASLEKQEKVRSWLREKDLDGVVISRRDNFAWLTTGGDNRVINCSEIGVGHAVITREKSYLVAYYMDSDRMMEDQVPGQGYEQVIAYWYQGDERLKALELAGKRAASDTYLPGAFFKAEDIMDLQWPLNDLEVERTRWLGQKVAEILEDVFYRFEPGMTGLDIQKILHTEIIRWGMDYEVPIVGTDERIYKHRHVLATGKPLEKYLLLGPVVRKWGLFALVSRSMHFGEPPADVQKAFRTAATIEGRVISMLKEGLKFSAILECQKKWYEDLGVANGWIYHFQGGPTGYTLVDSARSLTSKAVQSSQPFSWYTTVKGAKVEELSLLTANGPEICSIGTKWPLIEVDTENGLFRVPGMLIR